MAIQSALTGYLSGSSFIKRAQSPRAWCLSFRELVYSLLHIQFVLRTKFVVFVTRTSRQQSKSSEDHDYGSDNAIKANSLRADRCSVRFLESMRDVSPGTWRMSAEEDI